MAKTYTFRINLQPAEFYPGGCSVAYGLARDCALANEVFSGTLQEAIAHRQKLSDATAVPHVAFLGMANRSDRSAPGLKAVWKLDAPRSGA